MRPGDKTLRAVARAAVITSMLTPALFVVALLAMTTAPDGPRSHHHFTFRSDTP